MKTFHLTQVAATLIAVASAADIRPYGQVPAATALAQAEAEAEVENCHCHGHDPCDCHDDAPLVELNVYEADDCCEDDSDPEDPPVSDVCPGPRQENCDIDCFCPVPPPGETILTSAYMFSLFVNLNSPNDRCLDICEFECLMGCSENYGWDDRATNQELFEEYDLEGSAAVQDGGPCCLGE